MTATTIHESGPTLCFHTCLTVGIRLCLTLNFPALTFEPSPAQPHRQAGSDAETAGQTFPALPGPLRGIQTGLKILHGESPLSRRIFSTERGELDLAVRAE